jgi:chaperonin cofactor prefoldin
MASNPTASLGLQLEVATRKYQDLQEELSKAVGSREKLGAQQVETESVKKVRECLDLLSNIQNPNRRLGIRHSQSHQHGL